MLLPVKAVISKKSKKTALRPSIISIASVPVLTSLGAIDYELFLKRPLTNNGRNMDNSVLEEAYGWIICASNHLPL